LAARQFGDAVRRLCTPYYNTEAQKGGRPGIDPEVYVKMLMVGFFENLASERAIAARCADSLAVRAFLHYELTEATPHHSSFTVIRQRLPLHVYQQVFDLLLAALQDAKLLRGKHLAIDSSAMEANASLRSLTHRLTGEKYRQYVKRLAKAAGVDVSDPRAVSAFDRKRQGRTTSNADWQNPHDPDAKVGPDKKGVTRMLYKPEHIVDLETGAILDVELKPGDEPDGAELTTKVQEAEERVNEAVGHPRGVARVQTIVGDTAYCVPEALVALQAAQIRTVIPDRVANRQVAKLPDDQRQALRTAHQTRRSQSGRWLMRHRGEFAERSFVHVLDYGGARRTTLRGRENILKRYVIQAACLNLSILLRHLIGVGTLKQTWAASTAARAPLPSFVVSLVTAFDRAANAIGRLFRVSTLRSPRSAASAALAG
jgi:transposase